MQIYLSCMLLAAAGALATASTGCGNSAPLPSQYFSFKYTVTPPGTGRSSDPIILPIAEGSSTCDRANKRIVVTGLSGLASASLLLVNTANVPFQNSLNLDYHTAGTAQLDLVLPTAFDKNGAGLDPVMLSTYSQSQGLNCSFNIPEPDFFARLNGTFTCTSTQSAIARRLELTEGVLVAVPCGPGQ